MRIKNTMYVISAAEHDKYNEKLKLVSCPHCRVVGCLIGHGHLWGKAEKGQDKIKRGWRKFCSNRNRRNGCGRTIAIIEAGFLYHRIVDAKRLWQMLKAIADGLSIKAAWEKVSSPFRLETGYRLWHAFKRGQTIIRSILLRAETIPKMDSSDPNLQVIEHLQSVFLKSACPVADFQARFQSAFLSIHASRTNRSG
jgi:hypothetical protein